MKEKEKLSNKLPGVKINCGVQLGKHKKYYQGDLYALRVKLISEIMPKCLQTQGQKICSRESKEIIVKKITKGSFRIIEGYKLKKKIGIFQYQTIMSIYLDNEAMSIEGVHIEYESEYKKYAWELKKEIEKFKQEVINSLKD